MQRSGEPGTRGREQSTLGQIQEGVSEMGEHLQERFADAQEQMGRRYRAAEGMVARNPAPSLLVGFGIGFGLGIVLTTMLSHPEETWYDWSERRARDSMDHARRSYHDAQHTARHLPDAFHHLADSIRNLPDAIVRHLPGSLTRH